MLGQKQSRQLFRPGTNLNKLNINPTPQSLTSSTTNKAFKPRPKMREEGVENMRYNATKKKRNNWLLPLASSGLEYGQPLISNNSVSNKSQNALPYTCNIQNRPLPPNNLSQEKTPQKGKKKSIMTPQGAKMVKLGQNKHAKKKSNSKADIKPLRADQLREIFEKYKNKVQNQIVTQSSQDKLGSIAESRNEYKLDSANEKSGKQKIVNIETHLKFNKHDLKSMPKRTKTKEEDQKDKSINEISETFSKSSHNKE